MSSKTPPWPEGAQCWQPHCHLWADYLENFGASTPHNPIDLRDLLLLPSPVLRNMWVSWCRLSEELRNGRSTGGLSLLQRLQTCSRAPNCHKSLLQSYPGLWPWSSTYLWNVNELSSGLQGNIAYIICIVSTSKPLSFQWILRLWPTWPVDILILATSLHAVSGCTVKKVATLRYVNWCIISGSRCLSLAPA
jgi:hypothetical protein